MGKCHYCNQWIGAEQEKQHLFDNPTLSHVLPHDIANVKEAHADFGDCLLNMRTEIELLQGKVESLERWRNE